MPELIRSKGKSVALFGQEKEIVIDAKNSVRVATTEDIILSGLQKIDGIEIKEGDRVLVKDQKNKKLNGIYNASIKNWQRSEDADGNKITSGMYTFVESGEINDIKGFILITNDPIEINKTDLDFIEFTNYDEIKPKGENNTLQYNDNGKFNGTNNIKYNPITETLEIKNLKITSDKPENEIIINKNTITNQINNKKNIQEIIENELQKNILLIKKENNEKIQKIQEKINISKEKIYSLQYNAFFNSLQVKTVYNNDFIKETIIIPNDFQELISAEIIGIMHKISNDSKIKILTTIINNNGIIKNIENIYNLTKNINRIGDLCSIKLNDIFQNIESNNILGISIEHIKTEYPINYLFIKLKYK